MLLLGDCNHWLKEIKDESIDLIVTDPPYGIEFMGKDWDKALVPTETWKECYRVLKEGKLAFVMCSPRQDVLSRMIVNLQDAGFRTNYSSIYWTFASGFPKAANISKLIDKKAGVEREILGDGRSVPDIRGNNYNNSSGKERQSVMITKPATEEAKKMEGAYVGFQPKPAVEIILVVSKGKTLTWLDDCRIPYQSEQDYKISDNKNGYWDKENVMDVFGKYENVQNGTNEKGRFPANLLVSDDVLNDGKITKSTGTTGFKSFGYRHYCENAGYDHITENGRLESKTTGQPKDEGSYSRYFSLDAWAKTFPFLIVPKASVSERNKGCEKLINPKATGGGGMYNEEAGRKFGSIKSSIHNNHPTVKPLKLMSYLITMGSREGDLVLDPFCGSGTVCIAAHQLHRKWLGIEMNPEYAEIIKKRLADPLAQLKLTSFA